MLSRILVGVDGSPGARKAAEFAIELARPSNARVILLAVLERPTVVPFGPLDVYAFARKESEEQLTATRKVLDEVAHELPAEQVEKRVELGTPAETICEQAEKLGADLVVVGSRGHGAVGRWLLGSVADRVVHLARTPVTVVH